MFTWDTR